MYRAVHSGRMTYLYLCQDCVDKGLPLICTYITYIYTPWLQWALWKRKEKIWWKKKGKVRVLKPFLHSVRIHLILCLWESNLFLVLLLHTYSGTRTHALVFFCLAADDKTEVAFSDGKKGLEVKACDLHKSALYTLALHTHTHTNFPTLALFCLKACVQYLSLYSSLSSSLPHSVSLFLAHYFFLTSHCLSAAIKITTL